MIPLDTFRELFGYNYWARDRQFEACRALTAEQFLRPLGSSFSSLRDTLAHLVESEWVWLENWRGRPPWATMLTANHFPTLAALEERSSRVERELREYLAGLTDEALARPLTLVRRSGETVTFPLWRTVFHLLNHQTYHRGQVTTLLRQLGAEPVGVDFLGFRK